MRCKSELCQLVLEVNTGKLIISQHISQEQSTIRVEELAFLSKKNDINDFFFFLRIHHFLFAFDILLEYFIQSMHKKEHWFKKMNLSVQLL